MLPDRLIAFGPLEGRSHPRELQERVDIRHICGRDRLRAWVTSFGTGAPSFPFAASQSARRAASSALAAGTHAFPRWYSASCSGQNPTRESPGVGIGLRCHSTKYGAPRMLPPCYRYAPN